MKKSKLLKIIEIGVGIFCFSLVILSCDFKTKEPQDKKLKPEEITSIQSGFITENLEADIVVETKQDDTIENTMEKTKLRSPIPVNDLPIKRAIRTAINKPYAITTTLQNSHLDPSLIRFEVRPGDFAFNGSRSQIKLKPSFTKRVSFDLNIVQYKYENDWFSLVDWHNSAAFQKAYADKKGKNKYYSPLAIQLEANNLIFINRANRRKYKNLPAKILSVPLNKGWNHIELEIKWAADNTGAITIIVNDLKKEFHNIATTYDMRYPNFFKFGVYRSATYKSTSIIEFKNVIVDGEKIMPNFSTKATGEKAVRQLNGLKNK